jgi:hypothetical protein
MYDNDDVQDYENIENFESISEMEEDINGFDDDLLKE